jgi:hypothetical protein
LTTKAHIEGYFEELGFSYENRGENVWIGKMDENDPTVAVAYAPPLLILRMKLMDIPESDNLEEFYRVLLEMNGSDLDHGAFAIEGQNVIVVDTLQVENLDQNELQASIDSVNLAATTAYNKLSKFRS